MATSDYSPQKATERTNELAGHVAAGMSRSDLKDLGELLDAGTSGLIVVAATDVEGRVEAAIQHGKDIVKKQVQIDADGLKTEIDSL